MAQVVKTTVKWFDDAWGFGFIAPGRGGKVVFAHFSAIHAAGPRTLQEGQSVGFELEGGPRGPRARTVTINT